MSAGQPDINVTSLESEDVLLFSSSSPELERAFSPGRAKGYDPLLPYTAVIKNAAAQEIIAYSVLWKCRKNGGPLQTGRSRYDFSDLDPGSNLMPGSTEIVSFSLGIEAGGKAWDSQIESITDKLVKRFSEDSEITITLDAVLLADGTAVGPDESHSTPRWKAWLDAEQEVFLETTQSAPADVESTLSLIATPGLGVARNAIGDETGHSWQLGMMANHSNSYAECCDLARGCFALRILEDLKCIGRASRWRRKFFNGVKSWHARRDEECPELPGSLGKKRLSFA